MIYRCLHFLRYKEIHIYNFDETGDREFIQ